MNMERTMWRGQRAEAESRRRDCQAEIAQLVKTMRFDLNPLIDPMKLPTEDIKRSAERLAVLQQQLRATEEQIAQLDDLLGG